MRCLVGSIRRRVNGEGQGPVKQCVTQCVQDEVYETACQIGVEYR